jgi:hypothetical protein
VLAHDLLAHPPRPISNRARVLRSADRQQLGHQDRDLAERRQSGGSGRDVGQFWCDRIMAEIQHAEARRLALDLTETGEQPSDPDRQGTRSCGTRRRSRGRFIPACAGNTSHNGPEQAAQYLKRWYFWATHSRLEPAIDAARTVERHWDGILRWFNSQIANGLIEGVNSLVQAAKSKARGYRSIYNLKAMVYLLAGKLDLRLPV